MCGSHWYLKGIMKYGSELLKIYERISKASFACWSPGSLCERSYFLTHTHTLLQALLSQYFLALWCSSILCIKIPSESWTSAIFIELWRTAHPGACKDYWIFISFLLKSPIKITADNGYPVGMDTHTCERDFLALLGLSWSEAHLKMMKLEDSLN